MNRKASSDGSMEAAASSLTAPGGVPPPRSLADIPGLGPIRIRALQKAGWGSLDALRTADIEALLTVPGLTEIKARYIKRYLEPFTHEDLAPAPGPDGSPDTAPGKGEGAPARSPHAHDAPDDAAQLVQRATRAMGEVITVLLSSEAPQFRSRLLRILGQFALCAESLAMDAPHLSDEQRSRAIRRLRRAAKVLSEFAGSSVADRKAQGRVADTLEELISKLAECRLST